MKIVSRPQEDLPTTIGSGNVTMKLSFDQLRLISALVYQCRLGQATPYSKAAFELNELIANEYGDDFMEETADDVDVQVTIEDDHGNVILSTKSGAYYATLEV